MHLATDCPCAARFWYCGLLGVEGNAGRVVFTPAKKVCNQVPVAGSQAGALLRFPDSMFEQSFESLFDSTFCPQSSIVDVL